MADFPTTEEILGYGRDEGDTENYSLTESALAAAKTILSNGCHRQFVIATTSSARVFVPTRGDVAFIDDCTAVSSVSNDGVSVAGSYYQLEPLNGRTAAGDSVPYDRLRRLSGSWLLGTYGEATLSVTATWGWAAIPTQIIEACKIITRDILANREVKFGIIDATDAGAIVARTNPVVRQAIETYRRSDHVAFIA